MRSFCHRATGVALGLVLLLTAPLQQLLAQQAERPAVVVSVANVDKILADVGYLTRAAGTPEIGGLVTLMAGQYAEGLNTRRPIGIMASMSGPQPSVKIFVPVADFAPLRAKIEEAAGELEEVGGGVYKLTFQRDIFFKQADGWVFVSDSATNLDQLPADPTQALGELPNRYDVAVQINVQQIPEPLRQMAISEMRQGFDRGLQNQLDERQREFQEKLGGRSIQSIVEFIEGADQVTLGWGVDDQAGATHLDLMVTAVPGTKLARQFESIEQTTTRFAGFALPEAAATLRFSSPVTPEDAEHITALLQVAREQSINSIDEDDELESDQQRQAAKEIVEALLSVVEQTVRGGTIDGAAALLLRENSMQLVAGGAVADGAAIESSLKKLVDLARQVEEDQEKLDRVQFNAARHRDVDFHTLVVPVPADEPDARKVFGEEFTLVIGTAPRSAFVALGTDSMELLRRVIDQSAAQGEVQIAPLTLEVALTPIMEFAASIEDDPMVAQLAEALRTAGKDRISITASAIPRGASYRIQVQEGILQLIGKAAQMQNAARSLD